MVVLPVFIGGRGTKFTHDGPEVEISRDECPVARVPFVDLLEFANNHSLKANARDDRVAAKNVS